ncbi:FixJ family two-component response regulator [Caulobacter ginsengisoli]|uniref:FixJ family two-component response regulator n=1 Tax=Caulobacter ginsengisoli TaxID=400775 RepID=A0ABU0IYD7_9CAUL|nr:response regulator [Caulobacter ginsengisoli]MDQ0465977.1 FixJ family two-component response regulator [Caulobacter ginsengisoli]
MLKRSPTPQTVVLVDDDAALLASMRFMLELEGLAVETLDSAEALLDHPLPPAPACLVLDQHFEGLSGLDALRRLRERGATLPALLITSRAPPLMRDEAASLGAVVVEKPLLGDGLLAEIRAALAVES